MTMVERALAKNPGISVGDLFEKAKKMDPRVATLSRRQFHARYPLQVKRRKGGTTGAKKAKAKKAAPKRAAAKKATVRKATAKKAAPRKAAAKKATARKAAPKKATKPAVKRTRRAAPKRRAARKAPVVAAATTAAPAGLNRDVVREQFLRFATELAGAEDRKSVVRVLSGVEKYVERAVRGSK
jgi:hypothetical protein